jgi:hypothetical protein
MEIPTTKCSKCGKELPLDQDHFYVRSKDPLIFRKDCKECVSRRGANYREANHEKVLEGKRRYCKKNIDKLRQKAREYNSRDDVKERNREYAKTERQRKKHSELNQRYRSKPNVKAKIASNKKRRYHANLEDSRKKAREYKNLPEVKARTRIAYHSTKTPQKRLRNTIRTSIIYHLKRFGQTKNGSLVKHLGYSIDDLKKHIENLWEPWMNWENWGPYNAESWDDHDSSTWTWHIDHIKRHHEFDYDSMEHPEFKACWALDNLRPLSAKENVIRQ